MYDFYVVIFILVLVGGFVLLRVSKSGTFNRALNKDTYSKELDITSSYWQFTTTASAEAVMNEIEGFINLQTSALNKFFIAKRTPELLVVRFGNKAIANFNTALSFTKEGDVTTGIFLIGDYIQHNGMSMRLNEMEQLINTVKQAFKDVDPNVKIQKGKKSS
jgi:triacylglycerol esterase/lipase EstA (alpha/beta hydrolase family)